MFKVHRISLHGVSSLNIVENIRAGQAFKAGSIDVGFMEHNVYLQMIHPHSHDHDDLHHNHSH